MLFGGGIGFSVLSTKKRLGSQILSRFQISAEPLFYMLEASEEAGPVGHKFFRGGSRVTTTESRLESSRLLVLSTESRLLVLTTVLYRVSTDGPEICAPLSKKFCIVFKKLSHRRRAEIKLEAGESASDRGALLSDWSEELDRYAAAANPPPASASPAATAGEALASFTSAEREEIAAIVEKAAAKKRPTGSPKRTAKRRPTSEKAPAKSAGGEKAPAAKKRPTASPKRTAQKRPTGEKAPAKSAEEKAPAKRRRRKSAGEKAPAKKH